MNHDRDRRYLGHAFLLALVLVSPAVAQERFMLVEVERRLIRVGTSGASGGGLFEFKPMFSKGVTVWIRYATVSRHYFGTLEELIARGRTMATKDDGLGYLRRLASSNLRKSPPHLRTIHEAILALDPTARDARKHLGLPENPPKETPAKGPEKPSTAVDAVVIIAMMSRLFDDHAEVATERIKADLGALQRALEQAPEGKNESFVTVCLNAARIARQRGLIENCLRLQRLAGTRFDRSLDRPTRALAQVLDSYRRQDPARVPSIQTDAGWRAWVLAYIHRQVAHDAAGGLRGSYSRAYALLDCRDERLVLGQIARVRYRELVEAALASYASGGGADRRSDARSMHHVSSLKTYVTRHNARIGRTSERERLRTKYPQKYKALIQTCYELRRQRTSLIKAASARFEEGVLLNNLAVLTDASSDEHATAVDAAHAHWKAVDGVPYVLHPRYPLKREGYKYRWFAGVSPYSYRGLRGHRR